jgi:hypothetical protein
MSLEVRVVRTYLLNSEYDPTTIDTFVSLGESALSVRHW